MNMFDELASKFKTDEPILVEDIERLYPDRSRPWIDKAIRTMIDKKQMCFEREKYIDELKSELLGPGSEITFPDKEHEIITESPDNRYSIGILYPKESFTKTEEDEKEEFFKSESNAELEPMYEDISNNTGDESNKKYVQGEEDCLDEEINLASQNKPSSMGIIFFAKGNTDKLVVHLNFHINPLTYQI